MGEISGQLLILSAPVYCSSILAEPYCKTRVHNISAIHLIPPASAPPDSPAAKIIANNKNLEYFLFRESSEEYNIHRVIHPRIQKCCRIAVGVGI